VTLSAEMQEQILAFIRAGCFDHVAAEAAGISARTFYDWIERGEDRHPSRPCTRKLRAFAQAVRRAKAEVRAVAEARVFKENPTYWLTHVARSKPDREGWSTPQVAPEEEANRMPTLEERIAELDRQEEEQARRAATEATSDCPDANCGCPFHQRRYFDELERSRRGQSD
jgi:hypothetical protein